MKTKDGPDYRHLILFKLLDLWPHPIVLGIVTIRMLLGVNLFWA